MIIVRRKKMKGKQVYVLLGTAAAGLAVLALLLPAVPFYIIGLGALYTGGLSTLIWKNILQV